MGGIQSLQALQYALALFLIQPYLYDINFD